MNFYQYFVTNNQYVTIEINNRSDMSLNSVIN